MKKILVTGGCGFIGSCLIRKLILETEFAEVVNIDTMTYAATEQSLETLSGNPRLKTIVADICDRIALAEIFEEERPDAIFHLAAETHVDRSIDTPEDFFKTNVGGTFALVQEAREYLGNHPNENFRFIHVSTDEVYGSLELDGNDKFSERSPYQPNSPYSASKAASDFIIRSWFHTFGFPGIITHCSNNYGPYQQPEKLIPKTIINFCSREKVPVYGDGRNIRDWIYVEDHCEALIAVLLKGRLGETYDIGGGAEKRNIELVNLIGKIVSENITDFMYPNYISFVTDRPGHDQRYAIDISKMREELNWAPRFSFEDGLAKTVAWYMKNKKWWHQDVKAEAYAF